MRVADDVAERIAGLVRRDHALITAKRGGSMDPAPDLLQTLVEATRALTDSGVPYALIGGVAVGIQSEHPRATLDVDLAVATQVTRKQLIDVLGKAGFRVTGEFEHSVTFVGAGAAPLQVAFDPTFDPMLERAEKIGTGDVVIRVLTVDDLIATKERAASDPARRRSKSLQDRAHVELLKGDVADPDEGW